MNNYYDKNTQTLYIEDTNELFKLESQPINAANTHTDIFYSYTLNAPIVNIVFGDKVSGEAIGLLKSLSFINYKSTLKTVTFGMNYKIVTASLFAGCTNLEKVEFKGVIDIIEKYAFHRCFKLKDINLMEGLEYINSGAFADCNKLDSITEFPSTLKRIGTDAFAKTNLEDIVFKSKIEIKSNAFRDCLNIHNITFLDNVKLGLEAFTYCQRVKNVVFKCDSVILAKSVFKQCLIDRLAFDIKSLKFYLGGTQKLTHANARSLTSDYLGAHDIRLLYYNKYAKDLINAQELKGSYKNIELRFFVPIFKD